MVFQGSRTSEIWYIERSAPIEGKIDSSSLIIEAGDLESRLRILTEI